MTPPLKPCPFCGSAPQSYQSIGWMIACVSEDCHIRPYAVDNTEANATAFWERRVDPVPSSDASSCANCGDPLNAHYTEAQYCHALLGNQRADGTYATYTLPVPSSVSSAIEEEANAARRRNGEHAAQTVEDIRAGLLHGAWDDREWLRVVSLRSDLPDDVRALVEKAKQALGGVTP